MIGVETAILGFLSIIKKLGGIVDTSLLGATIITFCISILCAAWVLSSIPSVTRRLGQNIKFTNAKLYDYECIPSWLTLDRMAISQHAFFFLGIFLFALVVFLSNYEQCAVDLQQF